MESDNSTVNENGIWAAAGLMIGYFIGGTETAIAMGVIAGLAFSRGAHRGEQDGRSEERDHIPRDR